MCEYREYLFCLCHHHHRGITPCRKMIWLRRGQNLQRVTVRVAQKIAGVRRPSRLGFWQSQALKAPDIEMGVLPPRAVQGPTVEEVQGRQRANEVPQVPAGHEVPAAIRAMGFQRQAPPAQQSQRAPQAVEGRMAKERHQQPQVPQVPAGHQIPDAIRTMGFERQAPPARVMDARQAAEGRTKHEGDCVFMDCCPQVTETPKVTRILQGTEILRVSRRVNGPGMPPVPSNSDLERAVGYGQRTGGLKGGAPRQSPPSTVEDAPGVPDPIRRLDISNIPSIPPTRDLQRAVGHVEKKRGAMGPSRLHFSTVPEEAETIRRPTAARMPPVPSNSDLERHVGPAGKLGGLRPILPRAYVRPSVEDIPEESENLSRVDFAYQPISPSIQHTESFFLQTRTQDGEHDIGDRIPMRVPASGLHRPLHLPVPDANDIPQPFRPMHLAINRRVAQLKGIAPIRRILHRGPSYCRAIQPQARDTAGAGARALARRAHRNRTIRAHAEGRLAEYVAATRPPARRRDSYVPPEPPVQLWKDKPPAKVMHRTPTDLKNHPPGDIEKSYYKFPDTDIKYDVDNPPGPFCLPPKRLRTENIGDLCPDCVTIYTKAKIPHHWANHYVVEYMKTIVYHDIIKLRHVADGSKFGAVMISGYSQAELDAIPQEKMYTGEWDRYWLWIHDRDHKVKQSEAEIKRKEEEKEAKKEKEKALKIERERIMQQRQPWRVDMEWQRQPTNQEIERENFAKLEAEKAKAEAAKRNEQAAAEYLRRIGAYDDAAIRKEAEERDRKLREARFVEYIKVRRGAQGGRDVPAQLRREFEEYERQELQRKTRECKVSEAQTQRQASVFAAYDPRAGMGTDFNFEGRFGDARHELRGVQTTQPPPRAQPRRANTSDDGGQRDKPILQRPHRAFTIAIADQIKRQASGLGRVPAPQRANTNVHIPHRPSPPTSSARKATNTDPHRNCDSTVTFSEQQPEIAPTRSRNRPVTFSEPQPEIDPIRPNSIRPAQPPATEETFRHYRDERQEILEFRRISYNQFDQSRFNAPRTPIRPALNTQANANTLQTPKPVNTNDRKSPRTDTPSVLPHGPQRANTTINYPKTPRLDAGAGKGVSKKPSKQRLQARKQDAYGDDYHDQGASEESNLYVVGEDSDDESSDKENKGIWKDGDDVGLQLRKLMSKASVRVSKILQHNPLHHRQRERQESFEEGNDVAGLWQGHGERRVLFEEEEERNARMSYIDPLDLTPFTPAPPANPFNDPATRIAFEVQRTPDPPANPFIDAIVQQGMNVITPQPQRTESYTFTHGLMTSVDELAAARNAISRPSAADTSLDDSYEEEFARRAAMLAPRPAVSTSPIQIRRTASPERLPDPSYFDYLDVYGAGPLVAEPEDDDLDIYGAGPSRVYQSRDDYRHAMHAPPLQYTPEATTVDDYDLDVYGAGPASSWTAPATPAPALRRPRPAGLSVPARQHTKWPSSGMRTPNTMERRRRLWDYEVGEERDGSPREGRTEKGGRWARI